MSRFMQANEATVPYSERKPERFATGDDNPDEAPTLQTIEREARQRHTVGYPHLKGR